MSTALEKRYIPNQRERTMAALAHASMFVAPGIGPLVLWLAFRGNSPFIGRHALRAGISQVGGAIVIGAISAATCGIGGVLVLPWMGFEVWEGVKAWRGEWDSFKAKGS